jgi:HSP20 family molecular chaperone IbpA
MRTYYRANVTDDGVELKFIAPETKLEDIEINHYEHQNGLSIFIPANTFCGAVEYTERLSDLLNVSETKATLSEGVLTVNIPYNESKKPKRIEIKKLKELN